MRTGLILAGIGGATLSHIAMQERSDSRIGPPGSPLTLGIVAGITTVAAATALIRKHPLVGTALLGAAAMLGARKYRDGSAENEQTMVPIYSIEPQAHQSSVQVQDSSNPAANRARTLLFWRARGCGTNISTFVQNAEGCLHES